jgi:hypothetical protein
MKRDDDPPALAPTRRAFFAMLGAAATVLTLGDALPEHERPRSTWTGKTRWIGHC